MSATQCTRRGLLILGVAVDPLHPGAGRSPGVVDLPVQRDALGYPLVYASSVKGALKSLCARNLCPGRIIRGEGGDAGKIRCCAREENGKCVDACECCCVFGGEPGEGEAGAGALAFLDLVPLAFPAPSADHGFVYVTTPVLLARIQLLLEAIGGNEAAAGLKRVVDELLAASMSLGAGRALAARGLGGSVSIGAAALRVDGEVDLSALRSMLGGLGGMASMLPDRLVVVSAQDGLALVERSLLRVTRVRLRRDRKTVATGALWTEEYIMYGTVFATGVVDTCYRNRYCEALGGDPVEMLWEAVRKDGNRFYAVVGGKETVGRGMIKFVVER